MSGLPNPINPEPCAPDLPEPARLDRIACCSSMTNVAMQQGLGHGGSVNVSEPEALAAELLTLTEAARLRAEEDPFGNPVLAIALGISRRLDQGTLDLPRIAALIRHLRDAAFDDRAARLARMVGGTDPVASDRVLAALAERLVRPDPADSPVPFAQFRAAVERTRFAAVFTAHPTFALPAPVAASLAEAASGRPAARFASHRPGPITLEEEFARATAAIHNGRDALDRLGAALLAAARAVWPDRWSGLVPRPVILASWVGYDTDGRTDIGWWDTLGFRLRMKALQLDRLHAQVAQLGVAEPLVVLLDAARAAVAEQCAHCPTSADPEQTERFAHALVERREVALVSPGPVFEAFEAAIAAADEPARLALCVARAGLAAHGLALAHTHVRLNAAQVHNAVRQRLGLSGSPEDASRRRGLLAAINAALDTVAPVAVDFGGLLTEQASAARLMMTVAQIVKHIDAVSPVRFLIAETESGYTLLAALWLARHFGVERMVEISPLFETAEALERGVRLLEEALRSPHWRAYLQGVGRLALQLGYSDSGRYVGQLAASNLIERLRLRLAETLARNGLAAIEVVFFDTHGESIGRGAHPDRLTDRLAYLAPPASRQALARAGLVVREESAFQGGDGFLVFATPELATAAIARIAEHAFASAPAVADPIYAEPDYVADFFATIRAAMEELVEDPGYAALLGVFGPALLDPTGSRPAARQTDGLGGPALIRHPRELRAIPNNAILQQLGWCANTLYGLGAAAARQPDIFAELRTGSERFRIALDLARHALTHSDLDVLRAVVASLDATSWFDRAAHARRPERRDALAAVARGVERLGLGAAVQAMFRRIQADQLQLRAVWPEAPRMAAREVLLHALRLALIHRIWLLATEIPDFSPRHGLTRQALEGRLLRLDVAGALAVLAEVFPAAEDPAQARDYAEPASPRAPGAYAREHAGIFAPIRDLFAEVREIGVAISHEVGAFG